MHDSAHTSKSIPFFLRLSRTPICSPAPGPPPARQIARFGLRPACPPPPCLATRRFAIMTPLLWTYEIRYFLLKPWFPAVYELDCAIRPDSSCDCSRRSHNLQGYLDKRAGQRSSLSTSS